MVLNETVANEYPRLPFFVPQQLALGKKIIVKQQHSEAYTTWRNQKDYKGMYIYLSRQQYKMHRSIIRCGSNIYVYHPSTWRYKNASVYRPCVPLPNNCCRRKSFMVSFHCPDDDHIQPTAGHHTQILAITSYN